MWSPPATSVEVGGGPATIADTVPPRYPAVFLPDPTRADDVRPLAVVSAAGFIGSVCAPSGTRMRPAVDAALAAAYVYATLLTVEGDMVRAHLPSGASRQRQRP